MKNFIRKFFALGLLSFVVLGCSFINKVKEAGNNQSTNTAPVKTENNAQTITSDDGSCLLSVPNSWSKQSDLNAQATLQVANPREEVYAIIIRESKSAFPSGTKLDTVTNLGQNNLRKSLTNAEISPVSSTTIGGFPAKQFDAGGTVSGLKAKYLYAVVESPNNFYQIMTWTLYDRYDRNKAILQEVINSFKEVGGGSSSISSNAKKP